MVSEANEPGSESGKRSDDVFLTLTGHALRD